MTYFIWIQEGFTPKKWFGGEFSVKWFGFMPESQSYRPKVGDTGRKSEIQPGRTPRIRTESPRKGPRMGSRRFYRNPPLKPSWIHLRHIWGNYTPVGNYCEINAENIIHVTEMRFSKKTIPKTLFHVTLWITNEYVICNFGTLNSRKKFLQLKCNFSES